MFWQLLFDKGGKPHSTLEYFCSSALWLLQELERKASPLSELLFPDRLFNPPTHQPFFPS